MLVLVGGLLAAFGGFVSERLGGRALRRQTYRQQAIQLALRDWEHKEKIQEALATAFDKRFDELFSQVFEKQHRLEAELAQTTDQERKESLRQDLKEHVELYAHLIELSADTLARFRLEAAPAPLYVVDILADLENVLLEKGDQPRLRLRIAEKTGRLKREAEKIRHEAEKIHRATITVAKQIDSH